MSQTMTLGRTATRVEQHGQNTYVWYHKTPVVVFDADSIMLNNGGWFTATTKLRMNQASNQFGLNFSVYQKDFDWFVTAPNGETHKFSDRGTFTIPRCN